MTYAWGRRGTESLVGRLAAANDIDFHVEVRSRAAWPKSPVSAEMLRVPSRIARRMQSSGWAPTPMGRPWC